MTYLLDTCAWLDALQAPKKLNRKTINILSGSQDYALASISILELARKEALGKLTLQLPFTEWLDEVGLAAPNLHLIHLSPEIMIKSTRLPSFEKNGKPHKDPGDQIVTATARLHGLTIITSDDVILSYPHVKSHKSR